LDTRNGFRTNERALAEADDQSFLKGRVQTHLDQLEGLYAELRTKSDLFSVARDGGTAP
jgi:hypothetical protein